MCAYVCSFHAFCLFVRTLNGGTGRFVSCKLVYWSPNKVNEETSHTEDREPSREVNTGRISQEGYRQDERGEEKKKMRAEKRNMDERQGSERSGCWTKVKQMDRKMMMTERGDVRKQRASKDK